MNDTSVPRPARPWPKGEFIIGANLPWVDYGCDFGASAWFPAGGLVARPEAGAIFKATMDRLARDGVTLVRHFLLCDCRSGARFDAAGAPIGLDDRFFRDADAALDAAAGRGISLIPVLFDFHVCDPPEIVNGVQLGGHADLVTDPSWRAASLTRIVRPIVERYGRHPAIAAWDLFNEPDWCVSGLVPASAGALRPSIACAPV